MISAHVHPQRTACVMRQNKVKHVGWALKSIAPRIFVARATAWYVQLVICQRMDKLHNFKHWTVMYRNPGKRSVRAFLWMQIKYDKQWSTQWKLMENDQNSLGFPQACFTTFRRIESGWDYSVPSKLVCYIQEFFIQCASYIEGWWYCYCTKVCSWDQGMQRSVACSLKF